MPFGKHSLPPLRVLPTPVAKCGHFKPYLVMTMHLYLVTLILWVFELYKTNIH